MTGKLRLGVNIDHVATVRNARGGRLPDPVRAAELAIAAGADGITAHLREDRRHIMDDDIVRLRRTISKPLNLEMAATTQMLDIALRTKPHAACIVPEKRTERTTEGGLDVLGGRDHLVPIVDQLKRSGIRVSLFIEPSLDALDASKAIGPRARLRQRPQDRQPAADRRAEHRPFPDRRGYIHRPDRGDPAHAGRHGRGPGLR